MYARGYKGSMHLTQELVCRGWFQGQGLGERRLEAGAGAGAGGSRVLVGGIANGAFAFLVPGVRD